MSKSGSLSWKGFSLVIIAVAASLLAYDVQLHGTFQKSISGRILKDYGMIKVYDDALVRLNVYYKHANVWWQKNYPYYYEQFNRTLGPYVRIVWDKIQLGLSVVWEALLPTRQWVNKTLPPLYEQFQSQIVPKVVTFNQQLLQTVRTYLSDFGLWIQTNVLTGSFSIENMQKLLIAYVTKAQQAAGDAYGWVSKQIQA